MLEARCLKLSHTPSEDSRKNPFLLLPNFQWLPTILHVSWLVDTPPPISALSVHCFPFVCLCLCLNFPLTRTLAVGLGLSFQLDYIQKYPVCKKSHSQARGDMSFEGTLFNRVQLLIKWPFRFLNPGILSLRRLAWWNKLEVSSFIHLIRIRSTLITSSQPFILVSYSFI